MSQVGNSHSGMVVPHVVVEDESMRLSEMVIKVEDGLFRVPRRIFGDSKIVQSLLANNKADWEHPLNLDGVDKADFLNFLRYVDPRRFRVSTANEAASSLTVAVYQSVLKLSAKLSLANVRSSIIRDYPQVGIIEKILLARDYSVSEWLVPALNEYASSGNPITIEDIQQLGTNYILKIVHVRESMQQCFSCTAPSCQYARMPTTEIKNRSNYDFTQTLQTLFEEEIESLTYQNPPENEAPDEPELGDFRLIEMYFLVEGRLFKSYRQYFESSPVFREMFALPVPDNERPDGTSQSKPLQLEGITKDDFTPFINIMNATTWEDMKYPVSGWISILKLSTMWDFTRIRQLAIDQLEKQSIPPAKKVNIAQVYRIQGWLLPALNAYAKQQTPMTAEDVDLLSWNYALKIILAREAKRDLHISCHNSIYGCNKWQHDVSLPREPVPRANHDFKPAIRKAFRDELRAIAEQEKRPSGVMSWRGDKRWFSIVLTLGFRFE